MNQEIVRVASPAGKILYILLIPFLIFLLVTFYLHLKRVKRWRIPWIILRIIVSSLLLFLILDLRAERFLLQEKKIKIAFFIDNSRSMSVGEEGEKSRFEKFKEKYFEFEKKGIFDIYFFSDSPSKVNEEILKGTQPSGLITSFERVFEEIRKRQGEYDAFIMYSDGIATAGKTLSEIVQEHVKNIKKNIVFIYPHEEKLWDAYIEEVEHPGFVYVDELFDIKVKVRVKGNKSVKKIKVQMFEGGTLLSAGEGIVKDNMAVVNLSSILSNPGEVLYEIRLAVNDPYQENNYMWFRLEAIKKKIRVIQLAGKASWDVRFLRKFLKDDPRIDLITFIILRAPEDIVFARSDELSLIPFPGKELFIDAIKNFDIIIFQDFPAYPYILPVFHRSIAMEVMENNLSFLFIGGEEAISRGGYFNNPLEPVIPVEMQFPHFSNELVSLELTPQGRIHYITSPMRDFKNTPQVEGIIKGVKTRKGCIDLLVHGDVPVLVACSGQKGARRVYIGTDTLWLLRKFSVERNLEYDIYGELIRRILRFLAGLEGPSGEVIIRMGDKDFSEGDEVFFRIEPLYSQGKKFKVEILKMTDRGLQLYASYNDVKENEEIRIGSLPRGNYYLRVLNDKNEILAQENFTYASYSKEVREILPDAREIKNISSLSHKFVTISLKELEGKDINDFLDEDVLYEKVKVGEKRMWHNTALFLILFTAMCLEWGIRRKNGFS